MKTGTALVVIALIALGAFIFFRKNGQQVATNGNGAINGGNAIVPFTQMDPVGGTLSADAIGAIKAPSAGGDFGGFKAPLGMDGEGKFGGGGDLLAGVTRTSLSGLGGGDDGTSVTDTGGLKTGGRGFLS